MPKVTFHCNLDSGHLALELYKGKLSEVGCDCEAPLRTIELQVEVWNEVLKPYLPPHLSVT